MSLRNHNEMNTKENPKEKIIVFNKIFFLSFSRSSNFFPVMYEI